MNRKPKNKYYYRSRISEGKFREIIRYFSADLTAEKTAEFTGLNRNTINNIFQKLRVRIALESEKESPLSGEVEIDESYFGPTRIRGKRGRGAGGKTIVFGLLKRGGKVYAQIVPDAKAKSLVPIIRGKVSPDSNVHTDGWKAYDGLVDFGFEKHYRVHHGKNEFARGKKHINGIESFWSYAKRRLRKFNGVQKEKFFLHLKETEFRFNYRNEKLYDKILEMLRKKSLN
jgi:transposase-like protein